MLDGTCEDIQTAKLRMPTSWPDSPEMSFSRAEEIWLLADRPLPPSEAATAGPSAETAVTLGRKTSGGTVERGGTSKENPSKVAALA